MFINLLGGELQDVGDLASNPCLVKGNNALKLVLKFTNLKVYHFSKSGHKLHECNPLNTLIPSMFLLPVKQNIIITLQVENQVRFQVGQSSHPLLESS